MPFEALAAEFEAVAAGRKPTPGLKQMGRFHPRNELKSQQGENPHRD